MIINNPRIIWKKAIHGYVQGIKGRSNYRHKGIDGYYNGYGGAWKNQDMSLRVVGKDENGRDISINVKDYFLESLGRKKMSEKLVRDIDRSFPEQIICDDDTKKISDESLKKIRENYEGLK